MADVYITYENTTLYEYVYKICMPPGWEDFFNQSEVKAHLKGISSILSELPEPDKIFPKLPYVMYALFLVPPEKIKVVLIGQDPYHNRGLATGLSFSVPKDVTLPPTLRNIFKELMTEGLLSEMPEHGSLLHWAKQGILMINATLTVLEDNANSHLKIWTDFSHELLKYIETLPQFKVAILWGKFAQQLGNTFLSCPKVISTHPSPLSATKATKNAQAFMGSNCFNEVNEILVKNKVTPIRFGRRPERDQGQAPGPQSSQK